jgi:hypothetical protein
MQFIVSLFRGIMKRHTALTCLVVLLALASGPCWAQAPSAAPSFTISASPVTMPSSVFVAKPINLTSVDGFVGTVAVTCAPPNPPAGVNEPSCTGGR